MVSEYIRDPFRNRIFLFMSLAALMGSLAACMKNETTNNESAQNKREHWQVPESLPGAPNFPPATRAALERALAAQPEGYEPRTHHFRADGGPKYTNQPRVACIASVPRRQSAKMLKSAEL